ELIHRRIVDHPGDKLALPLQRDGNGEDRDAVQEVGGAVQRVDNPAVLLVVALHNAALLHKEGIARPRARKLSEKDLLGTAVGLADVIAGPLERDLEILHLAKITSERTPGLHRGLDHDIDDGRARHWIM